MKERLLVLNPGSTSTKIAVYDDETPLFVQNITHTPEQLAPYAEIFDQYEFRRDLILQVLAEQGVEQSTLTAIVSRGGLLPPVESGAYRINDDMVWQVHHNPQNEHPSNLGAPIAKSLSDQLGIPAFVYDPVTVDEMAPIAKITGLPTMRRKALGHNLNMRAMAHQYAKLAGKPYNELTMVVAHLGGGITLTLHQNGRMVDMVSDEEGPFSPERAGGLPLFQVIKTCFSGGYNFKSMMKQVKNNAGLAAHLGTKDAQEIEARIAAGDAHARLIYEAMAYGIAKHIGQLAVAASGRVDAIILTGGIAHSKLFTGWIAERVSFIAPVTVLAGENEMQSLALGALRVLRGEEQAHAFHKVEGDL